MPKLNDIQTILLSTAARREDGSLHSLPDTLTAGDRVAKAITALMKAGFAEERETTDAVVTYRQDGDIQYGVFATAVGLAAIGVVAEADDAAAPPTPVPPPVAVATTKRDTVLALLARSEGATMAELIAATEWLPHTTRAALTGLRKKGHHITRGKRDGETCYSIASAA